MAARSIPSFCLLCGTLGPSSALADAPLNYLRSAGPAAGAVLPLTWAVLIVSLVVIVVISALVLAAIWRHRREPPSAALVEGEKAGMRWVVWGVGVSCVVLAATIVGTLQTFARVAPVPDNPGLTVDVVGYQWWWEARYLDRRGAPLFVTANEIHIPVGERVLVRLIAADVIHSFWIPALAGKTDLIPGIRNEAWMEAAQPGVYRGQCAEYCGLQHANMAMLVIAEPRERFDAWEKAQQRAAANPATTGRDMFEKKCGECHTVRGVSTEAGRTHGPDLTHLMSRTTLAAGTFANTPGHLYGWIANPRTLKPGTQMPDVALTPQELQAVAAFLATLS